jgi:hypothetical protein
VTTRQEYIDSFEKMVASQYEKHQIVSHDDVSWVIGPEGKLGNCWCEIRALKGRSLIVHGDIGPVMFAYGPRNAKARVRWMGECKSAADRYFVEKASIGRETLQRWNSDAAVDDIVEMLTEHYAEEGMTDEGRELIEDVRLTPGIYEGSSCETHLTEMLMENGFQDYIFDCGGFGYVPSPRMFHSHAALARLVHLLGQDAE